MIIITMEMLLRVMTRKINDNDDNNNGNDVSDNDNGHDVNEIQCQ